MTADLFTKTAGDMGYHPFPQPAAILSQPYKDLAGNDRGSCFYCGFCPRYGCEVGAKGVSAGVEGGVVQCDFCLCSES